MFFVLSIFLCMKKVCKSIATGALYYQIDKYVKTYQQHPCRG